MLGQVPRGGRRGLKFAVSEKKCMRKAFADKESLLLVRDPVIAKCFQYLPDALLLLLSHFSHVRLCATA